MSKTSKDLATSTPDPNFLNEKLAIVIEEARNRSAIYSKAGGIISEDISIKNCLDLAKGFIEQGADVNLAIPNGITIGHIAAYASNLKFLKFLIQRGLNLDAVDSEGQNLLHMAVINGDALFVITLIDAMKTKKSKSSARINKRNSFGNTPLHYAVGVARDASVSRIMVFEGADYNLKNGKEMSALDLAHERNPKVARIIENVIAEGSRDEIDNLFFRISLFFSVRKLARDFPEERIAEIDDFIHSNLDKSVKLAQDSERVDGENQIAARIMQGTLRLIYASIHSESQNKLNPQAYSKHLHNMEDALKMIVKLVDAGADVNMKTSQNFTALHFAAYFKFQKIIDDLCAKGADAKALDAQNKTPIYYGSLPTLGINPSVRFPKPVKTIREEVVDFSPMDQASPSERLQNILLNLPPRIGSWEIQGVKNLIENGADINASLRDGSSILSFVIKHKDDNKNQIIKFLLAQESLNPSTIFEEIKDVIASGKPQIISSFLSEEKVISKFVNLQKSQQDIYLSAWNQASKKSDITKKIKDFRKAVNDQIERNKRSARLDSEEVSEEVGVISKAEKERRRKAANKLKAEAEAAKILEREEKLKREIEPEIKFELAEIFTGEIADEIAKDAQIIEDEKEVSANSDFEDFKLELRKDFLEDEFKSDLSLLDFPPSKIGISNSTSSSSAFLSANAEEFKPASVRKLEQDQEEMQAFLKGPRQIKSIFDLPAFLHPSFNALLQDGHRILLKGSAVYQFPNSRRVPNDLDVEILVRGMSKWNDKDVQNFVKMHFDIEDSKIKIYRGPNNDGSVFTVNVKDEDRKLDISLYDRQKEPPAFLRWTISREEKVFFQKDGEARNVKNSGFTKYIRENIIPFDPRRDFMINPNARGLISRLCFFQTIGHIGECETDIALQAISPNNLADLLFREMKVDLSQTPENQKKAIQKKISGFADSHSFDENSRCVFISRMSSMLNNPQHMYSIDTKSVPQYQPMYQAISEMKEILVTKPSGVTNTNSFLNLDKDSLKKTGKSSVK